MAIIGGIHIGTKIAEQLSLDGQRDIGLDVSSHFRAADSGEKLTYRASGLPQGLAIDPNTGIIAGTLGRSASQGGDEGVYRATITATGSNGVTATETVTWNVGNPPPQAADDVNAVVQGRSTRGNVLTGDAQGQGRDIDPDGDPLSVTQFAGAGGRNAEVGTEATGINGGKFVINSDGSYTFSQDGSFDHLAAGETASTWVPYSVSDGEGGTRVGALTITVEGTNDVAVITPAKPDNPNAPDSAGHHGLVQEDTQGQAVARGKLNIVDKDDGQSLFDTNTSAGRHGTFAIKADGNWKYTLNNDGPAVQALDHGQCMTETFVVKSIDGSASISVTVVIDGTSEAPVASRIAEQFSMDDHRGIELDVSSHFRTTDSGGTLTYSARGLPPGLTIDPNTGIIGGSLDRSVSQGGDEGVYRATVTAIDSSGAVASDTFTWNVLNPPPNAVDDAITVRQGQSASGNVLTGDAQGQGRDIDPDGDPLSVTQFAGAGGRNAEVGTEATGINGGNFVIHADGSYTFSQDGSFDHLAAGQTASTWVPYSVSDGEGGKRVGALTVTVEGTNDVAVIMPAKPGNPNAPDSAGDHGLVREDTQGQAVTRGKLDIIDKDDGQSLFDTNTRAGQYGTFAIDADGNWKYTLNNDDSAVQALDDGQSMTETFMVKSIDGSASTSVTVVIDGTSEKLQSVGDTHGGNDAIAGGDGNVISGGAGWNVLSGGIGDDTFVWKLGDEGSMDKPAFDLVMSFSREGQQGKDVLDLRGLLVDLDKEADLTHYLNFSSKAGEGTYVNISSRGQADTGFDQKIVLMGLDLTHGGSLTDDDVIKDLLQNGNMKVYNEMHG